MTRRGSRCPPTVPNSCTSQPVYFPTRVVHTSPVHEHTVAAEQGLEGGLECASRELLRAASAASIYAEERHGVIWSAESNGQSRLVAVARKLRVESTVSAGQFDVGAQLNCTRVVHLQHSQLFLVIPHAEHKAPIAQRTKRDEIRLVFSELNVIALALLGLGVFASKRENDVPLSSTRGDEEGVGVRAVSNAVRFLSCRTSIHIARIELASAHIKDAYNFVCLVGEEQFVLCGSCRHSQKAISIFARTPESNIGNSLL